MFFPTLISGFKRKYPRIDIQITEGNTDQLEAMLSSGYLDFVIDNYHYDSTLYNKESYCQEHILLAVPRHFPINKELESFQLSYENIQSESDLSEKCPAVPLNSFSSLPFIMLTPGNDTRTAGNISAALPALAPGSSWSCSSSPPPICRLHAACATFISDMLVQRLPSFENLVYYKLSGPDALRQVFFYYKKHKYRPG